MAVTQSITTSKHGKPSAEISKAERKVRSEAGSFTEVFALHDIALRFSACPFNVFTMREAVSALTGRLKSSLQACRKILPAKHPALHRIKAADEVLQSINAAMESFQALDDACEYAAPKAVAGTTLRVLVIELGKAMERIEIACGAPGGSWDYLKNNCVDPFKAPEAAQEVAHG